MKRFGSSEGSGLQISEHGQWHRRPDTEFRPRSVLRSWISNYSCRKEQRTFRWAPSGHGTALAGESSLLVSSRLRNFLRGEIREGEPARPQHQLLGIVGRLQVLEGDRVGETLCRSRCLSTPLSRDSSVRQSIWLRIAPLLNEVILCSPAHMCCIPTGSRLTKRCKQRSGLALRLVYEPR